MHGLGCGQLLWRMKWEVMQIGGRKWRVAVKRELLDLGTYYIYISDLIR